MQILQQFSREPCNLDTMALPFKAFPFCGIKEFLHLWTVSEGKKVCLGSLHNGTFWCVFCVFDGIGRFTRPEMFAILQIWDPLSSENVNWIDSFFFCPVPLDGHDRMSVPVEQSPLAIAFLGIVISLSPESWNKKKNHCEVIISAYIPMSVMSYWWSKFKTTYVHCGVLELWLLLYFLEEKHANFIAWNLWTIVCRYLEKKNQGSFQGIHWLVSQWKKNVWQ